MIDETGAQLGILTSSEALQIAEQKNLDLVMISPKADPPVCKIIDYNKFRFEAIKREKEMKKNQKKTDIKEIWLSMTIEDHDMQFKAKQTMKFLENEDKVKVSIRMKGRQMTRKEMGIDVMNEFFEIVKEKAVMEKKPLIDGRSIIMVLAPLKAKK